MKKVHEITLNVLEKAAFNILTKFSEGNANRRITKHFSFYLVHILRIYHPCASTMNFVDDEHVRLF